MHADRDTPYSGAYVAMKNEMGYVIRRNPHLHRGWDCPFTVTHDGDIIDVTSTLYGAKRAIKRHRKKMLRDSKPFWAHPIVYSENTPGSMTSTVKEQHTDAEDHS